MASITRYLERRLKLTVNQNKSPVVKATKAEFLSFTFTGKKIRWSEKSLKRFRQKIVKLTSRSRGVSMGYRLKKLVEYIRGWMGYFRITEYYRPMPLLDQWIRRRIRCCFIKQWRKPKTSYRNLVKLGVDRIKAASIAASSKGVFSVKQNFRSAVGAERQLSGKPWACFIERLVDHVSLSWVNRRMRTRTYGGGGLEVRDPRLPDLCACYQVIYFWHFINIKFGFFVK